LIYPQNNFFKLLRCDNRSINLHEAMNFGLDKVRLDGVECPVSAFDYNNLPTFDLLALHSNHQRQSLPLYFRLVLIEDPGRDIPGHEETIAPAEYAVLPGSGVKIWFSGPKGCQTADPGEDLFCEAFYHW